MSEICRSNQSKLKQNFNFQLAAQQRYSDYQRTVWDQMRQIDKNRIYDQQLYRQVMFMSNIGASALPPNQLDRVKTCVTTREF